MARIIRIGSVLLHNPTIKSIFYSLPNLRPFSSPPNPPSHMPVDIQYWTSGPSKDSLYKVKFSKLGSKDNEADFDPSKCVHIFLTDGSFSPADSKTKLMMSSGYGILFWTKVRQAWSEPTGFWGRASSDGVVVSELNSVYQALQKLPKGGPPSLAHIINDNYEVCASISCYQKFQNASKSQTELVSKVQKKITSLVNDENWTVVLHKKSFKSVDRLAKKGKYDQPLSEVVVYGIEKLNSIFPKFKKHKPIKNQLEDEKPELEELVK